MNVQTSSMLLVNSSESQIRSNSSPILSLTQDEQPARQETHQTVSVQQMRAGLCFTLGSRPTCESSPWRGRRKTCVFSRWLSFPSDPQRQPSSAPSKVASGNSIITETHRTERSQQPRLSHRHGKYRQCIRFNSANLQAGSCRTLTALGL